MSKVDRRRLLIGTSLIAATPRLLRRAGAAGTPSDDAPSDDASLSVGRLCAERVECPLGLEEPRPRLSWSLTSAGRGARQSAYRVTAASSRAMLEAGGADLWDSGKVVSDRCFDVEYDGKVLHSRQRVWWRVEVWDGAARASAPSEASWFEMGLLEPSDWQAEWLDIEDPEERADREAGIHWIWSEAAALAAGPQQFRYRLELSQPAREVELLLAAKDHLLGLWIDGRAVPLPPPAELFWGTMRRFSIPPTAGAHVIAAQARADSGGFMPGTGGGLAALVKVRQAGGEVRRLAAGGDWRAADSAPPGWQELDFDDRSWLPARTAPTSPCDPRPPRAALWARREFDIAKPLERARLYATALGAYEVHINGRRLGTARLAPEITVATDHVLYQCHDAAPLLKRGSNDLAALIGDGWYASAFSWTNERYSLGDSPRRFLAQLVLDYSDGSREVIATDASWRLGPSAVRSSEIYNGEDYDARKEHCECDRPAAIGSAPPARRVAQIDPPIRALQSLAPHKLTQPRPGVWVFDFGQNFAGWCRLRVKGPAGTAVRLRHAEILLADGGIDCANLRGARATDTYTLRGDPAGEVYEPHFTYHGFRYVELTGYPGRPDLTSIEGIVAHTDARQTGALALENSLAQRIWHNALWSQRSNFFGVPTDCPQRDERMGWMGDIQVFLDAAAFNMDVDAFIRRFMGEVRAGQTADGAFPIVTPQPRSFPEMVTAGWSDAGVILPWTLYRRYGDIAVIQENWPAMQRWLDYVADANPDFIWRRRRGLDLGDWLSVDAKSPSDATTPKALVATAFWARCASLMAEMAAAIGHADDAARYARMRAGIEEAFAREFVRSDGTVGNDSQTGYSLSLRFGLVPAPLRAAAGERLAADIERRGTRLSTGFLGTPYLLDALADTGHEPLAVALLLQTQYPSWGFMIERGATTMWERWNGGLVDASMNSYNHYAYGAVAGFMYRRLAGIAAAAPGFRRIAVDPIFDRRLGRVRARYDSCLGPVATDVRGDRRGLSRLGLELPANSMAEVRLPGRPHDWLEGGRPLGHAVPRLIGTEVSHFTIEVGSGRYDFRREHT